ncbi:hypothetical protein FOQG_17548 [Fusarium oxysporum f. sp. raphani 54005]|uniref:Uncharacterized protein n=5 Tax=Fusarium oxysporum TaxID=5507 RepID=X0BH28_FUSOX|nr:hypothetical protein FOXG_16445 [Fusarium oxysporum f. sp. lycopersici 4287]EXK77749.1 hypothetical protein FOQG_17548 [Fusarium oxysporum f. sp. raphani 54005]KAJ9413888.1 hypothetical protein QL093DRAFT_2506666 [Fusarium oxysporum]KNB19325.1 hypothetical protein FOXG_16445 [Fusarium oxysporum f. sp. lycopersici 4287]TVY74056.1 hypothetical protein Focb16_v005460 [Fusarium oxysporum f. sp. cubense]
MSSIRIQNTTAVIEWDVDDTTRSLATPDPINSTIQFTLRLDAPTTKGQRGALFEVMVPVRFKDRGKHASIYLRLSPLFISSFAFTIKTEPSDDIKTTFSNAVTCLDLTLEKPIAFLAPRYVQMPVTAARLRSGAVLDALRELSRARRMRIYVSEEVITAAQLTLIQDAISQRTLEPLSGPDTDISRMFGGLGGKPVHLSLPETVPALPTYDDAAALPPPAPPLERKRPRSDSDNDGDGDKGSSRLWTKVLQLESIIMTYVEKPRAQVNVGVEELRTENTQLRERVACLEDKVLTLQNKNEELERDMAILEQANKGRDEEEDTQLISISEDIESLASRVDWIERGKDDEAFADKIKGVIFDELAARVAGG